jgi:hypothetical protein
MNALVNALAQIERNVASALLDPFTGVPAPIDAARRLRARASRHFGCDIIGFVRAQPSHLSTVLHFGEAFPGYLRSLGRAVSFEYLADVAEIEAARARAMRSADARPIGRAALASLSSSRMRELGVLLHPSVSLVASRFPIVTVWAANQVGDSDGVVPQWGPQAALVARPFLDVDVVPLSAGGYAFLRQLVDGAPLAAALAAATVCDPASDPAAYLRLLIEANIVVGVHRCGSPRQIELF